MFPAKRHSAYVLVRVMGVNARLHDCLRYAQSWRLLAMSSRLPVIFLEETSIKRWTTKVTPTSWSPMYNKAPSWVYFRIINLYWWQWRQYLSYTKRQRKLINQTLGWWNWKGSVFNIVYLPNYCKSVLTCVYCIYLQLCMSATCPPFIARVQRSLASVLLNIMAYINQ